MKPKPQPVDQPTSTPADQRNYEIIGLQEADYMPIVFDGREYNLAKLTDAEAEHLLLHPEQVPHIKKLDASQTSA